MTTITMTYAELEISLRRILIGRYEVELRFSDPEPRTSATADEGAKPRAIGEAAFDFTELLALQVDPAAYGDALTRQVFHNETVRKHFIVIKSRSDFVRIRLWVHPSAMELNTLRWELLRDPDSLAPIATSEKMLFSRFVEPRYDWLPVKLRRRTDLKALVVVSAPTNLAKYKLPDVDLSREIERARNSILEARHVSDIEIEVETLGETHPVTAKRLFNHLRDGMDILYLVCHGELSHSKNIPILYLQNENREVETITGDDIVERLGELRQLPRLVVLASCESAKPAEEISLATPEALVDATAAEMLSRKGSSTAPGSLAQQLVWEGVPAVIAMQGKISIKTIEEAMPVFFRELLVDGQIDRALAVARGTVREHHDFWMPALFQRLRNGRIWYEPGFGEGKGDEVKWRGLISHIESKKMTPILGWGLAEKVYGSRQNLAQHLAQIYGFPLAPHQRRDLPAVSQYLEVNENSRDFALGEVQEQMRQIVYSRHRDILDPDCEEYQEDFQGDGNLLLNLLEEVSRLHRKEEHDPYAMLAQLEAKVYISATPDNLLAEALRAAGREPDQVCAFWNEDQHPSQYEGEPTVENPLIYYIFGHFDDEDSVVLTQDDYFDYLINFSAEKDFLPGPVRGAWTNSALTFLGFQLTDWSFHTLLRMIMKPISERKRNKRFAHTAVQIDPEDSRFLDIEQARSYLKQYYAAQQNMNIFWGSAGDFLQELHRNSQELRKSRSTGSFRMKTNA